MSAPLRSCDTCHAIPCICWAAPITREQRRVLDAARAWRADYAAAHGMRLDMITNPLAREVFAAIDELMPHPRFYAPGDDGWIYDRQSPVFVGVVRVHRRELLPVVLAALNAQAET